MHDVDKSEAIERYSSRYRQFGYDPRTLGWNKGRQCVRFAAVLECLGLEFESILDVGCGFGDLFDHLTRLGWRGNYVGIDICPDLVEEGRRRFGDRGAEFRCLELCSDALDFQADVAVAIGIFNHKLRGDNWEFVQNTLGAMWKHTRTAIAADFLSTTADKPHESLFHADPARMLTLGMGFSKRALLKHDYMPFEYCMAIWRDDKFRTECPVFEPYLKHVSREYLDGLPRT